MLLHGGNVVGKAAICYLLSLCLLVDGNVTQDQVTSRVNTLLDDVDDTQRQLDNEVKDRMSDAKSMWVIKIPIPQIAPLPIEHRIKKPPVTSHNTVRSRRFLQEMAETDTVNRSCSCDSNPMTQFSNWDYMYQWRWGDTYKDCSGASQSPVNLPVTGLISTRGARKLQFRNYDEVPESLTLINNGKNVIIYGHWKRENWPLIYGGAAHHRRYLFHSMTFFWPSEHTVGGFYYPMESQLLHISAEYQSFEEAVCASSSDPQAFLGVVNIYKFNEKNQCGLDSLMSNVVRCGCGNTTIEPVPLSNFSPPFKRYVCYQGSLTTPPCTEAVLWLVRSRTLPITRNCTRVAQSCLGGLEAPQKHFIRMLQPLNDRKVYQFLEDKLKR